MPDDIPESVKKERLQHIIKMQEQISRQINAGMVGRSVEVLVQGQSRRPAEDGSPTFYGRTPQNKTTIFQQPVPANRIVTVDVDRTTSHTLFGQVTDPESQISN